MMDIKKLTPEAAWEGFVGGQSPAEFMKLSPGMTIEQSVSDYVEHSQVCQDVLDDDFDHLVEVLAAYAYRQLKWEAGFVSGTKFIRRSWSGSRPEETYDSLKEAVRPNECLSADYEDDQGRRVWEVADRAYLAAEVLSQWDSNRTSPDRVAGLIAQLADVLLRADGEALWQLAYPDGDPHADSIVEYVPEPKQRQES